MITGINHLTLAVSDLERSFRFYTQIVGLRPRAKWLRGAYLVAGDDWICLSLDRTVQTQLRMDYTHVAFSVSPQAFAARAKAILVPALSGTTGPARCIALVRTSRVDFVAIRYRAGAKRLVRRLRRRLEPARAAGLDWRCRDRPGDGRRFALTPLAQFTPTVTEPLGLMHAPANQFRVLAGIVADIACGVSPTDGRPLIRRLRA